MQGVFYDIINTITSYSENERFTEYVLKQIFEENSINVFVHNCGNHSFVLGNHDVLLVQIFKT